MSVEPPVGFDALPELIWAGESRRKSPGRLTGAGVAVAVPTPVAGAADWAEMTGSEPGPGLSSHRRYPGPAALPDRPDGPPQPVAVLRKIIDGVD